MSIKGKSQELYIGKTEVNIKDYQWGYKLIKIHYSDISKIEYCFRTMTEGGYMDFHDTYGHFESHQHQRLAAFLFCPGHRIFRLHIHAWIL